MKKIDVEQITLGLNIVENSINPIIIFDEDFNIIDSNQMAKKLILTNENQTLFSLFESFFQNEKDMCDMWINVLEEDFLDLNGVKLYTNMDNTLRVYKISIITLDNSKNAMIFNDETEYEIMKRETESLIRLIDQNVIYSKTDWNGIITEASQAFCDISGYTKDELIGKSHNILRHPDMKDEVFKDLWKTIIREETWIGEVKNKTKDGGYYIVDAVIKPEFDHNNKKYGYVSIRTLIEKSS